MKSKKITLGNAILYYEIEKKQEMIIYLHGNMCNSTVFRPYIKYFNKKGFGSLAIDLRGEGRSIMLFEEKDYKIGNYISDVLEIMKKEKIKKAIFAGNSLGGFVAQAFAAAYPGKVSGLILISTGYHPIRNFQRTLSRIIMIKFERIIWFLFRFYRRQKNKGKKKGKYPMDFSNPKLRDLTYFELVSEMGRHETKETWKARKAQKTPIRNINLKPLLKKIKAPALIIHGDSDFLIPSMTAYELYNLLPNATPPVIFPKVDHDLIIKEPELILEFMENFILKKLKKSVKHPNAKQ